MNAQPITEHDWKIIPGGLMDPKFIVIDLFCGAGGTTVGYKLAKQRAASIRKKIPCAMVIACVNHDAKAIQSHWKNSPEVEHFNEDITSLYGTVKHGVLFKSPNYFYSADGEEHAGFMHLLRLVEMYRAFYPKAKVILWASLECTNFSKAKGGQARDADSRTLAEHMDRYICSIDPDYVKIENVVEFLAWGPMRIKCKKTYMNVECPYSELAMIKDKKTKELVYGWEPISKKNGQDYQRWREKICAIGYQDKWKELNSADYGAYTSRNRLFGIFHRPELPASFPKPTHSKKPAKEQGLFDNLEKWKAVKDVLDFSDEGDSILNRIKPIKTQLRARVLLHGGKKVKSVYLLPAGMGDEHIHHPYSFCIKQSMLKDFDAIVAEYRQIYGSVSFWWEDALAEKSCERVYSGLVKYVAGGKKEHAFMQQLYACDSKGTGNFSINGPGRTITTRDATNLVQARFLSQYNSGSPDSRNTGVDEPCRALLTENTYALINPNFLTKAYSGKPDGKVIPVTGPAGTITTVDGQSLVQPKFIMNYQHSSNSNSIEEPSPTLVTHDKYAIINPNFIIQRNSGQPDSRIVDTDGPARTLTGSAGNQELVQPIFLTKHYSSGGQINSIHEPASTLSTKDRISKVQTVWLDKQYSNGDNHQSIEKPAGTIVGNDKHALIHTNWIDRQYTTGGTDSSIEEPAGALLPVPKINLVQTDKFIVSTNYDGDRSTSIEDPLGTITANRKWHYLINPQYSNNASSVDEACFTLIAGMDKMPPYLVVTVEGELAIEIYDTDCETLIKIKEFMALYGIADIKMRMLKVKELLSIQGFPNDYVLDGSQADKKKFIGNSVVPHIVKCWAEQLAAELEYTFPELYLTAA